MTESGHYGNLLITYEVGECEKGREIVCIKGILVSVEKDGHTEVVVIDSEKHIHAWVDEKLVSTVCIHSL